MIFFACGFNLFRVIFSVTLLGWLIRLIVRYSDTAAGCLSWEVWWLRTGSTGLAFLLSASSCCRTSFESCDYVLSTFLDHFCWDVVDSSWFFSLQWLYCSLHFFAKDGLVVLCVCLRTVQYRWISVSLVIVWLRAVFCSPVQYLSFFCQAFSRTILDSNSFPFFHSSQVFHKLICPLTVVLPRIFFNVIALFSYPVLFCLFRAPLDGVVRILIFLRSFKFKSFLSQFSPFVAQIKNLCSDPGFLSFDDVCQGSHWLFQSLLCWRWWSLGPCLYLHCSWWWEVQTSRLG